MDAVVELLMKQYKMTEKQARAYAADIHSRHDISRTDTQTYKLDSEEKTQLKQDDEIYAEALEPVAQREMARMAKITDNLNKFKELHRRKAAGGQLGEANEKWYEQVRKLHDDKIRANAQSAADQDSQNTEEEWAAAVAKREGRDARQNKILSEKQSYQSKHPDAISGAGGPPGLDLEARTNQDAALATLYRQDADKARYQARRPDAVSGVGAVQRPQLDFNPAQVQSVPAQPPMQLDFNPAQVQSMGQPMQQPQAQAGGFMTPEQIAQYLAMNQRGR